MEIRDIPEALMMALLAEFRRVQQGGRPCSDVEFAHRLGWDLTMTRRLVEALAPLLGPDLDLEFGTDEFVIDPI